MNTSINLRSVRTLNPTTATVHQVVRCFCAVRCDFLVLASVHFFTLFFRRIVGAALASAPRGCFVDSVPRWASRIPYPLVGKADLVVRLWKMRPGTVKTFLVHVGMPLVMKGNDTTTENTMYMQPPAQSIWLKNPPAAISVGNCLELLLQIFYRHENVQRKPCVMSIICLHVQALCRALRLLRKHVEQR